MLGHDRGGLTCPRAGGTCPIPACPGRADPAVCRHLAALRRWRALSGEAQALRIGEGPGGFVPSDEPARGRIRVGLLCPCLGLGGAEAWQLALARSVDPEVVTWRGAAVLEGRAATDPRMLDRLSAIMPVGHGLGAARALVESSDVVVTWAVANYPALLSGLDRPPRLAMACHFPAESPWGEGTADLLRGVDRLVAVSELALGSIPPRSRPGARVIWNAVDSSRMEPRRDRATVRESWGVPPGASVAGYLGRLSPEKDPDAMLRLAAHLPEPWHVVVVGEGRERAALAQRAGSIAPGRVHLVGGDPSAGDVLNAFDTLVVPSRFESFGLTLAEGLWAGVPVISTPSGLAKLVPGLVRAVPVEASGALLAGALLADQADAASRRSRVERARAFALDRLGLDRFGREWTRFLVELAGRGPGLGADDSLANPINALGDVPCLATPVPA